MPVIKIETQAIIIGAGPAGASTSIFLDKYNIPHIVIEKERFPRDKVCGDAFSTRTIHVLKQANPDWLHQIFNDNSSFMATNGAIFIGPDGRKLHIPFGKNNLPGHAPGFTSSRLVFDKFLFDKIHSASATVFENAAVKSIERGNDKITIDIIQGETHYQVSAPLLVGADGEKSQVKKALMPQPWRNKGHSVALRAYFKGVTGFSEASFIELFYLTEILPGYFWIFPLPNGMANIGLGFLSDKVKKEKINLRKELMKLVHEHPIIKQRFSNASLAGNIHGWSIPMNMQKMPISGDHFLLAGDAGCLVNPFTGEGIGNALYSGMVAADAIKNCLQQNKFNAGFLKKCYDDIVYRDLGAELKASAWMQRLFNNPRVFNFLVRKVHSSKTLHHAICSMFNGTNLYSELKKPSFYGKVLLNR
ncbi:MAG: geranylgeranyl reductase family protein [Chitinophagaceae bacterium]